jgi:hypothetical protein
MYRQVSQPQAPWLVGEPELLRSIALGKFPKEQEDLFRSL